MWALIYKCRLCGKKFTSKSNIESKIKEEFHHRADSLYVVQEGEGVSYALHRCSSSAEGFSDLLGCINLESDDIYKWINL